MTWFFVVEPSPWSWDFRPWDFASMGEAIFCYDRWWHDTVFYFPDLVSHRSVLILSFFGLPFPRQ